MPGIDHVEFELFGVKEGVVNALAREEGVESLGGGLANEGSGGAGDDADALHTGGPERQRLGRHAEEIPDPGDELLAGALRFSPHADDRAVQLSEPALHRDAEPAGEYGVVADVGVEVEGKM